MTDTSSRRTFLLLAVVGVGLAGVGCAKAAGKAKLADAAKLTVYKSPTCGCCGAWIDHMRVAGFTDIEVVDLDDLTAIRASRGIKDTYASCHTGVIGDYAVEGHVPAADVRRLLRERPKAIGLAVPGMPGGSPGMEMPGGGGEPFDTLLLMRDGSAKPFARHTPA